MTEPKENDYENLLEDLCTYSGAIYSEAYIAITSLLSQVKELKEQRDEARVKLSTVKRRLTNTIRDWRMYYA